MAGTSRMAALPLKSGLISSFHEVMSRLIRSGRYPIESAL